MPVAPGSFQQDLEMGPNQFLKPQKDLVSITKATSPPPMAVKTDLMDNIVPRSICGSVKKFTSQRQKKENERNPSML